MFGNPKHLGRWLAMAVAVGLFCASQGLARKPVKPPTDERQVCVSSGTA